MLVVVGQNGFLSQVSLTQKTLSAPLQHFEAELVRSGSPSGWQLPPLPFRVPTAQHSNVHRHQMGTGRHKGRLHEINKQKRGEERIRELDVKRTLESFFLPAEYAYNFCKVVLLVAIAGVVVAASVVVVGQLGFLTQVSKGQSVLAAPLQHVWAELVRSGSPSGWQVVPLPLRNPTLQHLPPLLNGNGKAHGQAVEDERKF